MVHLLEDRLGVALFERKANRLALTPAGRAYQSGLTPIFDALASLTAQVTAPASLRVLTIGVGPTFAMRWLIPRLADFRKEEPAIDVRITTGGAAAPFADDWSCGIKLGDGDWPGLVAEPLFAADLLPVCTPKLAAALKRPADLKGPSLLRVAHSPDDWPSWLKAAGRQPHHRTRTGIPVLRPGAAGRHRRARRRHGHPPLYRRRPRRRPAGRALCASACPRACAGTWSIARFRTEQRDFAAFRRWIIARRRDAGRRQGTSADEIIPPYGTLSFLTPAKIVMMSRYFFCFWIWGNCHGKKRRDPPSATRFS